MGFFNSLPVPESSKVIPAHPWPIQRFPCCFIFTLTFLHQLFITFTFYYKTIIPRRCTATSLITTSSSSCLLSTCQHKQTHTKDENPSVAKCILATGILGETERTITPTLKQQKPNGNNRQQTAGRDCCEKYQL